MVLNEYEPAYGTTVRVFSGFHDHRFDARCFSFDIQYKLDVSSKTYIDYYSTNVILNERWR